MRAITTKWCRTRRPNRCSRNDKLAEGQGAVALNRTRPPICPVTVVLAAEAPFESHGDAACE